MNEDNTAIELPLKVCDIEQNLEQNPGQNLTWCLPSATISTIPVTDVISAVLAVTLADNFHSQPPTA